MQLERKYSDALDGRCGFSISSPSKLLVRAPCYRCSPREHHPAFLKYLGKSRVECWQESGWRSLMSQSDRNARAAPPCPEARFLCCDAKPESREHFLS